MQVYTHPSIDIFHLTKPTGARNSINNKQKKFVDIKRNLLFDL